jgi:hypothetical protein
VVSGWWPEVRSQKSEVRSLELRAEVWNLELRAESRLMPGLPLSPLHLFTSSPLHLVTGRTHRFIPSPPLAPSNASSLLRKLAVFISTVDEQKVSDQSLLLSFERYKQMFERYEVMFLAHKQMFELYEVIFLSYSQMFERYEVMFLSYSQMFVLYEVMFKLYEVSFERYEVMFERYKQMFELYKVIFLAHKQMFELQEPRLLRNRQSFEPYSVTSQDCPQSLAVHRQSLNRTGERLLRQRQICFHSGQSSKAFPVGDLTRLPAKLAGDKKNLT